MRLVAKQKAAHFPPNLNRWLMKSISSCTFSAIGANWSRFPVVRTSVYPRPSNIRGWRCASRGTHAISQAAHHALWRSSSPSPSKPKRGLRLTVRVTVFVYERPRLGVRARPCVGVERSSFVGPCGEIHADPTGLLLSGRAQWSPTRD